MGKILALDFGTKRIGYAVSDEQETIAFPRGFFVKKTDTETLAEIAECVRIENIKKIIIGVPLGRENEETVLSEKARKFGHALAKTLSEKFEQISIEYIDEFNSSDEALKKIPLRKDRRTKGIKDAIAAHIILQRYLDAV